MLILLKRALLTKYNSRQIVYNILKEHYTNKVVSIRFLNQYAEFEQTFTTQTAINLVIY